MNTRYKESIAVVNGHGGTNFYMKYEDSVPDITTLQKAKEELGETEQSKKFCLIALRNKLQNIKGLKCCLDEDFLVLFLRVSKYNVDNAFGRIKVFYKQFNTLHNYFKVSHFETIYNSWTHRHISVLPYRMKDGSGVVINRMGKADYSVVPYVGVMLFDLIATGIQLNNELNQICGMHFILDFAGFSLKSILYHTPGRVRYRTHVVESIFPIRYKGIHVVNAPAIFIPVYRFAKSLLSKKLVERIFMHPSDDHWESLHEQIPPEILPKEYGGKLDHSDLTEMYDVVKSMPEIHRSGFSNKQNWGVAKQMYSTVLLEIVENAILK